MRSFLKNLENPLVYLVIAIGVIPTLNLIYQSENGMPHAILGVGIFTSLILGVMIHLAFTSLRQSRIIDGQRKTLSKIIDSSPLATVVLDTNGRVTQWNPACERVYGWTREEAMSRPLPFVTESQRAQSNNLVKMILDSEEPIVTEAERQRRDGTSISIQISAMCLRNEKNEPYGLMAIMDDITTRKNAEQQLRFAQKQSEKAVEAKSEFLANMSHEIRTPLNGIIGMTDLILETHLSADQRKYAHIIQSSGTSLLALINDILDLSKGEAGKIQFESSQFSLASVVESQADLMIVKAREKNLSLMTFVDPYLPPTIIGDPGRLGQILLNLIGNAIKFTEKGGVAVTVKPGALPIKDTSEVSLRFEVQDTGIGLSHAGREKLFQPFSQVDGSTARKYGGTGLGLSIAKKLAEQMGGQIGVDSVVGKGSTFWFEIVTKGMSATRKYESEHKVLVLDGDRIAADVVSKYLTSWKMDFQCFSSEMQALTALLEANENDDPFDIVVLGEVGSLEDSVKLGKKIHAQFGKNTSVILLNHFESAVSERDLRKGGFKAIIDKPVKQSTFYDAIVQATSEFEKKHGSHPSTETPDPKKANSPTAHILVADDVIANQLLSIKILESLGFTAQAVANGKEVLAALVHGKFDLILMDCQMPEMDGYETTKQIRQLKDDRLCNLPIIALTANAMSGDNQKCLDAGMDDYVAKPFKKEKIREVVTKWISKRPNSKAA